MGSTAFGTKLRRARIESGLSQRELAEAAGLSERAVNDLECGRHRWPYPTTVRRLAAALGIEGEEFRAFALAASREDPRADPHDAADAARSAGVRP